MKKFVIGIVCAIALCIASVSLAATANFSWVINPVNTDNSVANVANTVTRVYQSSTSPVTTSGTLVHTSAAGATSANGVGITALCGRTYYFAVTATADGNTSEISDTQPGSYPCGTPGKPTMNPVIMFK